MDRTITRRIHTKNKTTTATGMAVAGNMTNITMDNSSHTMIIPVSVKVEVKVRHVARLTRRIRNRSRITLDKSSDPITTRRVCGVGLGVGVGVGEDPGVVPVASPAQALTCVVCIYYASHGTRFMTNVFVTDDGGGGGGGGAANKGLLADVGVCRWIRVHTRHAGGPHAMPTRLLSAQWFAFPVRVQR